jgi:outer membrane biosynthesis protein TonB
VPKAHPTAILRPARRFSSAVAALCAVVLVGIGAYAVSNSHAAVNQLYFSPSSATLLNGASTTLAVYVNTGTDPVNAVEADISYNPAQLQYVSYNSSGSAFVPYITPSGTPSGTVKFTYGTAVGSPPVTGTALVLNVVFKAVAGSGTAAVTFMGSSAVVRASDAANILTSSGNAAITLTSPATPTPTPATTHTPTPTPKTSTATKTPTPTPTSVTTTTKTPTPTGVAGPVTSSTPTPSASPGGTTSVSVDNGITQITLPVAGDGQPQVVHGTIQLVLGGSVAGAGVTYKVDGHAYKDGKIDTTLLTNGSHTVVVTVTDASGQTRTINQPLAVSNNLTILQTARNTLTAAFGGKAPIAIGVVVGLAALMLLALAYAFFAPKLHAHFGGPMSFSAPSQAPAGAGPMPSAGLVMPAGMQPPAPPAPVTPSTPAPTPPAPAPEPTPPKLPAPTPPPANPGPAKPDVAPQGDEPDSSE